MIKSCLIIYFLLVAICSIGQVQPRNIKRGIPSKKEDEIDRRNHDCVYRQKYSATQRLKLYPFNLAKQIKIVSFDFTPDSVAYPRSLPLKNGHVDYSNLKEIFQLNKIQINSLTDILFNWVYRGPFYTISEGCYDPRNAILFIDSSGKTFAFLELCFECNGYRKSSNKIKTGDFCTQKYDLLKDFFLKNGIVFGTKERMRED